MTATRRPVIGFLTDFGLDGAAATCRGVILGICPDAQIVDISHTVAKYAIGDGSFLLRSALPYLPVGVHVGVVDPGVGTERRPVGISTGRGDVLVGPDNGLLAEPADALGGIAEVRELTNAELWLAGTSATFHGRDIFAPVAAHLAAGDATFEAVGAPIDPGDIVRLEAAEAIVNERSIHASVIYVDSFGNVRLSARAEALERAFGAIVPGARLVANVAEHDPLIVAFAPSFGHVAIDAALLYRDSSGNLALALNRGDLAGRLGIGRGASVRLSRPD